MSARNLNNALQLEDFFNRSEAYMEKDFRPTRQRGVALHFGALLLNLSAVGFLIILALSQSVRGFFILYLIASILIFIPVPIIAYRLFALIRAKYSVFREGINLQWGLRTEDIPMGKIEWVRLASDLVFNLPTPSFSIEGAFLGTRNHRDLGRIEYVASTANNLVLIATRERIYAISPQDPRGFINAFTRSAEMGSIAPIEAKTSRADFLVGSILKDKLARMLILSGIILSVGLLVAVSFIIPTRDTIPLGFSPIGQVAETSPSDRLLLLPLLSLLMLTADIGLGSYLYRKAGYRIAAYFAFASSLIMPVSFLGLIIFLAL